MIISCISTVEQGLTEAQGACAVSSRYRNVNQGQRKISGGLNELA